MNKYVTLINSAKQIILNKNQEWVFYLKTVASVFVNSITRRYVLDDGL
jgi:hypothetical protein